MAQPKTHSTIQSETFRYAFRVFFHGKAVAVFPTACGARWYARHHRDSVHVIQKCVVTHDGYLVSVQGLMAF